MSERGANDFRERARVEADRYGPDPWIFVRELLQNARDAGARAVVITVSHTRGPERSEGVGAQPRGPETTKTVSHPRGPERSEGVGAQPRGSERGQTVIHCRDDGEGMSYEHARRYLFSLYASSKEDRANQVGRFGVGFWSILRFDPTRITIRSCPRGPNDGGPWQVVLDGELQHAERAGVDMKPGTEIVLERPAGDGADERRVFEAAQQNARFLCLRDDPDTPLPITVNGRPVNAKFTLAPPSSAFRRGHVRGVVGLGNAPRVELFSRGLRVRSAACLDDLLTNAGHTGHSRVRFPELPGGLAPQALLESDGLELLLSRSDARDTRTLRRLVKLGQSELRQLVERQLARIRPPGIGERLAGLMRRLAGESTWWRALLGAATGAVLAVVVAQLLWPNQVGLGLGFGDAGAVGADTAGPDRTRYGDLRKRYHGPQVSELDPAAAEPLALRYAPATARPYFAAVIIERVSGDAGGIAPLTSERYPGAVCSRDCIEVALPVDARGGDELPIPIPSGHRLDVESLVFEADHSEAAIGDSVLAGPKRVFLSAAGEAVLVVDWSIEGTLRYRTGPGSIVTTPPRSDGALPSDLHREARALRELPLDSRLDAAIDLVRGRVSYETSAAVAEQHQRAAAAGEDFVTRTLEIGAGDCDVQNGLLVAFLHAADVDARLAVGWVGHRGRVSAWLHAWVEYLDGDGRWRVADATARAAGEASTIAGLPPAPEDVAVGTLGQASDDSGEASTPTDPIVATPGPGGQAPTTPSPDASPAVLEPSSTPPILLELVAKPWVPWLALGSGVLGLLGLGLSLSRRTARRFNLDEGGDLSSLLQGALAQPAAFRHLPSLFHRRLIPLRGGAAISLNRARALASEGRLYAGREQTEISRNAQRRGVPLLDVETPEGRTVAASLGAVDLDRWGLRLGRASESPALALVAGYLREHNERWRCAALVGLGGRVATLDLRSLGSTRKIGDRLVLVDAQDPWLVEAERLRPTRPHAAAFTLLDHLLDHLDLGPERRARLLAPLAAEALRETARLDEPDAHGENDHA
ncbi:Transglutaminase-like superfamily protein [Enhygromyxa salina]|uniref:Transglutaminase-like superfamily protein n=1 Tax=Enhygromyxa salina TaxID=215803 RepID=A0A2S9XG88_9BACT|nr:transglutaminase domain-containing protein [Enhygromyxa salina]PRP91875.1 Transglutaminase-like superfamily protein [Enhygromyxa salina]